MPPSMQVRGLPDPFMKSKMALIVFLVLLFSVAAFSIGSGVYRLYRTPHPYLKATILSGPQAGRSGTVVSFVPYDLRVTINTPATEAEVKDMIDEVRTEPWFEEVWAQANFKDRPVWHSTWRWNVKFHKVPQFYDYPPATPITEE